MLTEAVLAAYLLAGIAAFIIVGIWIVFPFIVIKQLNQLIAMLEERRTLRDIFHKTK